MRIDGLVCCEFFFKSTQGKEKGQVLGEYEVSLQAALMGYQRGNEH